VNGTERLLAAAALAAALAAAWTAPRRANERVVLAAVDAEAFAGLTGRRPSAAADLWERLRAMGVTAAVLREETLADLDARGEVLMFSRAEVEKWRVAGLVSPGSTLRGGTLWSKDPKALGRAAGALAARGLDVSTTAVGGGKALEIPGGTDLAKIPAGFDPGAVAALSSAGLIPVAASTSPVVSVAGRRLWTRSLRVDARPGEILRAALGRPMRIIVFRPAPEQTLEENVAKLRDALRGVREADQPETIPAAPAAGTQTRTDRRARLALVWFCGLIAPLLSVRAALQTAKAMRSWVCRLAPPASPVPQVLAGLIAAWATAAFSGLAIAGLAPEGWRDGGARAWTLWTWCAPLALGASALFAAADRRRGWSAPLRRRDLAAMAAAAAAVILLVAPRASLRASFMWESFDRASGAGFLWWWPWHWRAALVGVPGLAAALALIESRDSSDDPRRFHDAGLLFDPRGWLLLGLLGPAGLIAAQGGGGAPLFESFRQGAASWVLGVAFGGALMGAAAGLSLWAKRPKSNRTIDLEPGS
jgi:hypothetical protein